MSSKYGDVWERYATQLQLKCFEADEVREMVGFGRRLEREGKPPWEIPVVNNSAALRRRRLCAAQGLSFKDGLEIALDPADTHSHTRVSIG